MHSENRRKCEDSTKREEKSKNEFMKWWDRI